MAEAAELSSRIETRTGESLLQTALKERRVTADTTLNALRGLATVALLAHTVTRAVSAQMQQVGGTRPSISHDGRWISYQAARDGNWDIYVARIDGSDERRVSDFSEKNFAALGPASWLGDNILVPRRRAVGRTSPSSPDRARRTALASRDHCPPTRERFVRHPTAVGWFSFAAQGSLPGSLWPASTERMFAISPTGARLC